MHEHEKGDGPNNTDQTEYVEDRWPATVESILGQEAR